MALALLYVLLLAVNVVLSYIFYDAGAKAGKRASTLLYTLAAGSVVMGLIYIFTGVMITRTFGPTGTATDGIWFYSGMILMFVFSLAYSAAGMFVYCRKEMHSSPGVVRARTSLDKRA